MISCLMRGLRWVLFVSWLLSGRFSVGIATAVYNNGYSITLLVCLNGPCKSVLRVMHKTFKLPYFAKTIGQYSRSRINSTLKWRSHTGKFRVFFSILCFKSGVISLVRRITRSHSMRALFFKLAVSSLSPRAGEGSLNSETPLLLDS